MAPFVDVTALEIEVKGESTPLNVVLHPYATHVPGKNLVGTTLKKMITVTKYELQHEIFMWYVQSAKAQVSLHIPTSDQSLW